MDKNDLIQKWLNNELSPSEHEMFSKFDDFKLNEDILKAATRFKASQFSTVDDFNAFKKKYQDAQKPTYKLWNNPFLRVACLIAVLIGSYYFFIYDTNTIVRTYASEKTEIELPDQSLVMLNTLSEITYNSDKWSDNRELNLEGEAFFKVAKGKQFDVITSQGIVSVVGTEFNVKQRDNYFEVKCFEGVVNVTSDARNRQLTAGQVFQIINGYFVEDTITYEIPYWTNNMSVFKAIPLSEVIQELGRQYDIEVELNTASNERLFTGGFVHDDLENALISVTQPMSLTYKMSTSKQVVIHEIKN